MVRFPGAFGKFLPRTVNGVAPSFEQACAQLNDFAGLLLTRIEPLTASRSSGFASKAGATLMKICSSASCEPRRAAALIPPIVVLPPEPPDAGYRLSPIFI